jgi:hypothetical protein
MKIDRVILATDSNPLYVQFWNPISKVWKTKFDIEPTLIFLGTQHQLQSSNLSEEYGKIIRQEPVKNIQTAWTSTWSLYYYTQLFLEDTIVIMGIDQLPLSKDFLVNRIKDINHNAYVMLIADAYDGPNVWQNTPRNKMIGRFPTAYHVAKGNRFKEIYQFEETFEKEILKIDNHPNLHYIQHGNLCKWGIDESYASHKLREYYQNNNNNNIVSLNLIKELAARRIDRSDLSEVFNPEMIKKINDGYFIESHLPRPLNENLDLFNYLLDNIR